jgi:hypothetical protein
MIQVVIPVVGITTVKCPAPGCDYSFGTEEQLAAHNAWHRTGSTAFSDKNYEINYCAQGCCCSPPTQLVFTDEGVSILGGNPMYGEFGIQQYKDVFAIE